MTAHATEFFTLNEVNRLKVIQDVVDRRLIRCPDFKRDRSEADDCRESLASSTILQA